MKTPNASSTPLTIEQRAARIRKALRVPQESSVSGAPVKAFVPRPEDNKSGR